MNQVFISYRRMDTQADAGRLLEGLSRHLGEGAVFRDIDGIEPGVRFDAALEQALATTPVVLILIGPQWLTELKRRAVLPERDFVRIEVASALRGVPSGTRVIPVLVRGAGMPQADDLQSLPDVAPLTTQNNFVLNDDGSWDVRVRSLAASIGLPYNWSRLALRSALFLLVAVPGLYLALQDVSVETSRRLMLGALAAYVGAEALAARFVRRR